EAPYYMQRLHLGPGTAGSATRQLGGGRLEAPSRRVRAALEEARVYLIHHPPGEDHHLDL
ncbi:hypothetical protein Pmani_030483, partial [Petrolisthes manimaculis]